MRAPGFSRSGRQPAPSWRRMRGLRELSGLVSLGRGWCRRSGAGRRGVSGGRTAGQGPRRDQPPFWDDGAGREEGDLDAARADPDQRPSFTSLRSNVPQLAWRLGVGQGDEPQRAQQHGYLPGIEMGDGLPSRSLRCTCGEQ